MSQLDLNLAIDKIQAKEMKHGKWPNIALEGLVDILTLEFH